MVENCDGRGRNIPKKSSVVDLVEREFCCKICYFKYPNEEWHKFVIWTSKSITKCKRCKRNLRPIPFEEEFGICRFNCSDCNKNFV